MLPISLLLLTSRQTRLERSSAREAFREATLRADAAVDTSERLPRPSGPRGAIVYHPPHGRIHADAPSLVALERSLRLLVTNYLQRFADDVLLLHTGEWEEHEGTVQMQRRVLAPYPRLPIRFHRIAARHWPQTPVGSNSTSWSRDDYTMRFFNLHLMEVCARVLTAINAHCCAEPQSVANSRGGC
jgi:hypothetical protein